MAEDFTALYREALAGLKTGGMSLEASLQEIEEGKRQAVAGGQQSLVSSGLSGTTMMAGVPIQAEKIASRQRLGARGRAEQTYLTTLASFAAFAQRSQEAELERKAAMERTQAGIAGQQTAAAIGAQPGILSAMKSGGGETLRQRWNREDEARKDRALQLKIAQLQASGGGGGGSYSGQFPSLYDQGGETAPSLGGDGYTPQTGDYMSVEGGPGGAIQTGGGTTSYGGGELPTFSQFSQQNPDYIEKRQGMYFGQGMWSGQ